MGHKQLLKPTKLCSLQKAVVFILIAFIGARSGTLCLQNCVYFYIFISPAILSKNSWILQIIEVKSSQFNLLWELVNKTSCSDILSSVLWYCPSWKSVTTHHCKKFSDDLTICKKIFLVTQSVKISSSHDLKSKVYWHGTKCLEIFSWTLFCYICCLSKRC